MIKQALFEALKASQANPDAMQALALVELRLAQALESQVRLYDLIEAWGKALRDVEAVEVELLKKKLRTAVDNLATVLNEVEQH